ncbi:FecR family protein [uncultured Roseobacter sp.]|uniref:FecR family protein n=1 Tax=uncultured Roseobacter sp. TaxID=114847 RepID=UPI0026315CB7|nr:FecR family protein [uncultured Roseobacter sp.]
MMIFARFVVALFLIGIVLPPGFAIAQVPPNCEITKAGDPERDVLRCAFGIILEIEAVAEMAFTDGDEAEFDLKNGAVLLEVTPGEARPQIRTPHAIAAVRGTVFVVDVSETSTAVFVVLGEVSVSPLGADAPVALVRAGEGIDVSSQGASEVGVWGEERAAALMARFGR